MLIACKYEEIYPPPMSDYLYVSDGFYKQDQVLEMERTVLSALGFNLGYSSPLYYLRRNSKVEQCDVQTRTLAKYLMEASILDEHFLPYRPSLISAASTYLARTMLKREDVWTSGLQYYSGYSEADVTPCVQDMLVFFSKKTKLDSIYKKFASSKLLRASLFVEQYMEKAGLKK